MIKLNYIQEFVELAESLNFSKAAEKMFVTQPVLSRHMAKLEEDMGCKLLERSTRQVSLTAAGIAASESFRVMLMEYQALKEKTAFLSSGKTGQIKISSPYYLTEDFVEPIVTEYIKEYPLSEVTILSCQPAEGLQSLMNGECDIFISLFTEDINEILMRVPFAEEQLSVICLKDHPLAMYEVLTYEDLKAIPNLKLISFGPKIEPYTKVDRDILKVLAKHGIYINNFHYSQQVDTLGLEIQRTNGISILPYCLRNMNRSYLKTIPLSGDDTRIPMCIYYRADNKNHLIPKFVQLSQKHPSINYE